MDDEVKLGLGQVINLVVLVILLEQWRWVSHYLGVGGQSPAAKSRPGSFGGPPETSRPAQRPMCADCQAEAEVPASVEVSGPRYPAGKRKSPAGPNKPSFRPGNFVITRSVLTLVGQN